MDDVKEGSGGIVDNYNHPDHDLPAWKDKETVKDIQATAGVVGAAAAGYVAGHMMSQRSVRPGSGGVGGKTTLQ